MPAAAERCASRSRSRSAFTTSVLGFRGAVVQLGRHRRLLRLRVAELEKNGVRLNRCPGLNQHAFHAAVGQCRDPTNFVRDKDAVSANLPEHRPALYAVDPQRAAFNGRRRGFQAGERHRGYHEEQHDDSADHDSAPFALLSHFGWASNIHVNRS